MMRTPSSNAACASGVVFGTATGAIGFAAAPGFAALCPQALAATASASGNARRLLVTAHFLHLVEGDLGLAGARGQPELGLLRVFILRQPRQRLPQRLGVVVVDADGERLGVAGLVRVERLVLDHDDDFLELVAIHLLLVFLEVLGHGRAAHRLGERLVALADAVERRGRPFGRLVGHDVEVDRLGLLEALGLLLEHLGELLRAAGDLDPLVVTKHEIALNVPRLRRVVAGLLAAVVFAALALALVRGERLAGGVLGGSVVARLEVRVGLACQRLDRAPVAGIALAVGRKRRRGAAPVLLFLADDRGLKRHVFGVAAILVALGVLAVMLDRAIVLAEALAQDARAAERVGGVRVLRVPLRQLLVQRRRLVVIGDALLDAGGGEQRVGRLARGRVLVGELLVRGDRLLLLLRFFQYRARVVERLGRVAVLRVLLRDAHVEPGRLVVLAVGGVLLTRLHHRADDQLVEPLLLVFGRERLGLLEPARPALDILVVLGLVERLQDPVAGRARVGIVGVSLDDQAEALHRLVVVAVVEEELTVLVDDGDDLLVLREQRRVEVGRLAEQAVALG